MSQFVAKKLQEAMNGTPSGASELKAMLERTKEELFSELHNTVGLCRHCGKHLCAGRASNSYLPESISTEDVLQAIEVAISKMSSNV